MTSELVGEWGFDLGDGEGERPGQGAADQLLQGSVEVGQVEWRMIGYLDVDGLMTDLNRVGLDF